MSALTVSKDEEKRLKGQGFLNNRGTDEFSARVITVNGKVTAAQHRCMAEAAEKFGNGNLTYTTRLSVEIQGIPYEKIEKFQEFFDVIVNGFLFGVSFRCTVQIWKFRTVDACRERSHTKGVGFLCSQCHGQVGSSVECTGETDDIISSGIGFCNLDRIFICL